MIQRSDRNARFSRRLLEAMGLGALAAGTVAACGGNVVVDTATGGQTTTSIGPGGATTLPSTTITWTTTPTSACNVTASPPIEVLEACIPIPPSGCPAFSDDAPNLINAIAAQLGVCSVGNSACCNEMALYDLVCGPDPSNPGACCYQGLVNPNFTCQLGRPFTAEGVARVAPVSARRDWAGGDAGPSLSELDPETRRALAAAWTRDAQYEHASVASFARLSLELLAVGAPAGLVRDAQRAMGDEIRHAEIGFALASAYAGAPVGPGPLPFDGALGRASLAEVAAAAVREGCIGETVAALAAAEARDAARDPAVRAALDTIADDEADHAAMAWRLVAWAYRSGDAEVRAAIAAAFSGAVDLGAGDDPEGDPASLRAHGRLPAAQLRALSDRVLAEVVRPSAAALLAS